MAKLQDLRDILPPVLAERLEPHVRLVKLRAGQMIIGHQDHTSDVFIVLEGTLRVELVSLGGREVILADIGPGELFGEYSAVDEQPRSANVSAIGACVLACVPGHLFRAAALASPETAEWLARLLVQRIRLLTERNFELNALAVRSRLHCELLRLCIDAGIADNRAAIAPAPTHAQFAARIGTHREAVTRELLYLNKSGVLEQKGRELTVGDVARLTAIVRAASGDVGVIQRAVGKAPTDGGCVT